MTRNIRLSSPWVLYLVRLGDAVIICLTGVLALHLRRVMDIPIEFPQDLAGYYALIAVGALLFAALSGEAYRSWRGAQMPAMLAKVAGRWLIVVALLLLWLFAFKASQDFSRVWFGAWVILTIAFLWIERIGVYLVLRSLRKSGFNLRHVALVGDGAAAKSLINNVDVAAWSGYKIVLTVPEINASSLSSLAETEVDEVWLALPLGDEAVIRETLHALRHSTASIRFAPDLFTLRLINHGVSDVLGVTMFDLSTSPMTGVNQCPVS